MAAVCHGPAALTEAKLNGEYLVKGKKVGSMPCHSQPMHGRADAITSCRTVVHRLLHGHASRAVSGKQAGGDPELVLLCR